MANRISDWEGLLGSYNETLAPQGKLIIVEKNEDGAYSISVSMPNGTKELYADGYYEDELCNLLCETLSWAIRYEIPEEDKTKSEPDKVIVLSVVDTEYERHILHVYKGKKLSEIRGEDLLPAICKWADDKNNAQESDENELKALAEELATKTMAHSESDHEYELDYVELTTF